MAYKETKHMIIHRFQVTLTRDDDDDRDERYEASVPELSGCTVHAASKAEALRKIRKAIDVWLDLADREASSQESELREDIEARL